MRIFFTLILLMNLISCFPETELEFKITTDSIEYFNYRNYPEVNQYSVGVKLNDDFTKKLEQITTNNIGRELSIILDSITLVKTIVQCNITSGSFVISNFDSPEDSKEFMQKLLKDQYSSKLYKQKPEDFEFKLSQYDSLYTESSKDYLNFDFQSASSKLTALEEITKRNSEDYRNILITYILMNLRANEYLEAKNYFDELNVLCDSENIEISDFYKRNGILHILILLGNNKFEQARELKIKYENNIDISDKLNYIVDLPFYSFICYEFGEYDKAINKLSEYINTFSKNELMKDNSYYLLKLLYFYSNKSYKKALELSDQILSINSEYYKYDTIQSKLWHSIILHKNGLTDESKKYYNLAITEFNNIDHPNDLTLEFLLTPYLGVFPDNNLIEDFNNISGVIND